jgi:hypothetical protein
VAVALWVLSVLDTLMKWLLLIPALLIGWIGMFILVWFQPAVCLGCGHEVLKENEKYDCPGHGVYGP